jgi:hypothetical protein
MTFRRLVVSIALLAVFTMAVRVSADTDTWWHLGAGRWMVENRQILTADPFSLTRAGQPWTNPSWLAQLLLYGTYRFAGLPGLNVLTALMVTLAFACIWPLMDGPGLLRAFVLVAAATVSGVYWSARPQILSFALAGACLLLLEKGRTDRRWWMALPLLLALWANIHGGFIIGLLLIGIYLGGELIEAATDRLAGGVAWGTIWTQRKSVLLTLLALLLVSAACVSLNPYGPRLLGYPVQTLSIGTLQTAIDEWQSPDFHRQDTLPFLGFLLGTMLLIAVSPKRKTGREVLLFAALAGMALVARRNIALFALCLAPAMARHAWAVLGSLTGTKRTFDSRPVRSGAARLVNLGLLGILAVAAAAKMIEPLSAQRNAQAVRDQQPVGAIQYLKGTRPDGPLFNSYTWGGYLIWDVWPEYLTYVDGRTDLFDDQVLSDYLAVWNGEEGWEEILGTSGVRLALIEPHAPVVGEMKAAGWRLLYSDQQAVLLAAPEPAVGG